MKITWLISFASFTFVSAAQGANYEWRQAANTIAVLQDAGDTQRVVGIVGELSTALQSTEGNCGIWLHQLEQWTERHEGELQVLLPRVQKQVRYMGFLDRMRIEEAFQPLILGMEESYEGCQTTPGAQDAMQVFDGMLWADATTVAM